MISLDEGYLVFLGKCWEKEKSVVLLVKLGEGGICRSTLVTSC